MGAEFCASLTDLDFEFEDSTVRVISLTSLREVTVADTRVGPLQEGKELETRYWIAESLVRAGYARFHEDDVLTFAVLSKLHWRETKLSQGFQISPLSDHFYSKLKRFLGYSRKRSSSEPMSTAQYLQGTRLAQDIVNCRLRKIVNLATSSSKTTAAMTQALTREERILFDKVKSAVAEWQEAILDIEADRQARSS
ncbi:DNA replication complex GINS family protein [Candidatus Bathyarchaeota archaeon]|nr:DNA replication complex GINS family protein [Candidatus Bathyarchaeota archaeon]